MSDQPNMRSQLDQPSEREIVTQSYNRVIQILEDTLTTDHSEVINKLLSTVLAERGDSIFQLLNIRAQDLNDFIERLAITMVKDVLDFLRNNENELNLIGTELTSEAAQRNERFRRVVEVLNEKSGITSAIPAIREGTGVDMQNDHTYVAMIKPLVISSLNTENASVFVGEWADKIDFNAILKLCFQDNLRMDEFQQEFLRILNGYPIDVEKVRTIFSVYIKYISDLGTYAQIKSQPYVDDLISNIIKLVLGNMITYAAIYAEDALPPR